MVFLLREWKVVRKVGIELWKRKGEGGQRGKIEGRRKRAVKEK
jgi:hypothetical protein